MLSAKQQRFVEEYPIDCNATQAAIRAGYSAKTAEQQGYQLLRLPAVQEAVRARLDRLSEQTGITAERVLQELGRLAFADLRMLFDDWGKLRPIHELNDEAAATLAGMDLSMVPDGDGEVLEVRKIKLWDKTRALEMLCRNLGLFHDKLDLSVTTGLADKLTAARKRIEGSA